MNTAVDAPSAAGPRRRALVTGATGFVGSHLTRELVRRDYEVVAAGRPGSDLTRFSDVLDRIEPVSLDLTETVIRRIDEFEDVSTVFHLAGAGLHERPPLRPERMAEINVTGTLRVLELARDIGATRFVHCGSGHEYGPGSALTEDSPLRPITVYGATKAAASLLTAAFGADKSLEISLLRPFTIYGPSDTADGLVGESITRALAGHDLELTGGSQTRDFVFIEDVVDAFILAAESDAGIGVFNVCTGVETSVQEVVELILALCHSTSRASFGSLPYRAGEPFRASGDGRRAEASLGWTARTPLREGLERTIAAFRERRIPAAAGARSRT